MDAYMIVILVLSILLITLIGFTVFYPVGKNRCMKSAKNSKDDNLWCVGTSKPTSDGSCSGSTFKYKSNKSEKFGLRDQQRPGNFNPPRPELLNGDISNLDWQTNHSDHDDSLLVQRFMRVEWPEFSWTDFDGKRIFQKLTSDISRLGYTNDGLLTHFICPQMGKLTDVLGTAQVEVTVTKQRGYVDESKLPQPIDHIINPDTPNAQQEHWCNLDIEVLVQVWFPDVLKSGPNVSFIVNSIVSILQSSFGITFPHSKQTAIKVGAIDYDTRRTYLSYKKGRNPGFTAPAFTIHPEACAATYLRAIVNPQPNPPSGMDSADEAGKFRAHATYELHKSLFKIFNMMYHNILGGELSWNINMSCPELLDSDAKRQAWEDHRRLWQESMGTVHGAAHLDQSPLYDENHNVISGDLTVSQGAAVTEELAELLAKLELLSKRQTLCTVSFGHAGCLD
jgi:hypothetical protein